MEGSADLAALSFLTIFGSFWLVIMCISILVTVFVIWLFIACLIDVSNKDEAQFSDKTLWIILLIIGVFIPFGIIIPIIYFFMFKPKMAFWRR